MTKERTSSTMHETLRAASAEEACALLDGRADIVFDELIALEIAREDTGMWRTFAAEWGGALHLMDEMNQRRLEAGLISEAEGEFVSRTYRLGTVVLSSLYDRLAVWEAQTDGAGSEPYRYAMNTLDCYFVPAYLDDYGRMHPERKQDCRRYVEAVRGQLEREAPLEAAAVSLAAVVQEYIRNLHIYAAEGNKPAEA